MLVDVLDGVHLDPKNVRLENADSKVEADIIEDLFVNEEALRLVEGICKVGYLTHETPIVVQREGRYVVVEGNRRLAALKAIQNPMLAPDYRARISALAVEIPDRDSLSQIRVLVAPSQEEADELVAAIHTSNLRKRWGPARQAAFFQAQVDAGRSLGELLERYPTIDVKKFVLRARIQNMFREASYKDPKLRDFLVTKQWARGVSTLARIVESKEFLLLTGIVMDDDGNVTRSVSDGAFDAIAAEIVSGIENKDLDTRSINSVSSPLYKQLMAELVRLVDEIDSADVQGGTGASSAPAAEPSQATNAKPRGRGDAPESPSGVGGQPARTSEPGKSATSTGQARKPKRKQRLLDLSQIRVADEYPEAVKLLVVELSGIDVQKFPNAAFLTIRAVLEKSIKSFAELNGHDIKGSGNNVNGYVQLGGALNWLFSYVKEHGPKHLVQPVDSVRTGTLTSFSNTKQSLDAVNHNHHFKVDADQVISMWASVNSIMRFVSRP